MNRNMDIPGQLHFSGMKHSKTIRSLIQKRYDLMKAEISRKFAVERDFAEKEYFLESKFRAERYREAIKTIRQVTRLDLDDIDPGKSPEAFAAEYMAIRERGSNDEAIEQGLYKSDLEGLLDTYKNKVLKLRDAEREELRALAEGLHREIERLRTEALKIAVETRRQILEACSSKAGGKEETLGEPEKND